MKLKRIFSDFDKSEHYLVDMVNYDSIVDVPIISFYKGNAYRMYRYEPTHKNGCDFECYYEQIDDVTLENYAFTQVEHLIIFNEIRCECGAETCNHPGHSQWCPKFVHM